MDHELRCSRMDTSPLVCYEATGRLAADSDSDSDPSLCLHARSACVGGIRSELL